MSKRGLVYHATRRARQRLLLAGLSGVAVAVAVPPHFGVALRAIAGWDAVALVLLGLSWNIIARFSTDDTRKEAAADDPGRTAVWIIVLVATTFSLFATTVVLRQARALSPHARDTLVALCAVAVIVDWFLTHTAYTLRYAHLYYRDDQEGEGGITFPGEGAPAYLDFAYFAFTIGMCFQVSDASVASRQIRRAVLSHGILSFAYNTAILAVAINLLVGVFG